MHALIAICLLFGLSIELRASSAEPLQIGYVEFPPFTYTDAEGQPAGIFFERVTAILAEAGLAWEARSYPAARLYDQLARGEVHLFMGIDTSPVIQGKVLRSQRVLGTIHLLAFTRKGAAEIAGPADMRGLRVGMQLGYSYASIGESLRAEASEVEVHDVRSAEVGFRMLAAERLDVMLHYAGPGEAAVATQGLDLERSTMFELPCRFIMSTQAPAAVERMAAINSGFDLRYPETDVDPEVKPVQASVSP